MTKKEKRQRDERINKVYRSRCNGIQIGIMDVSKVFAVGYQAINDGVDDVVMGDRIATFVETIRKN